MFQRRHYDAIASSLNKQYHLQPSNQLWRQGVILVASKLATDFEADNPNFDRVRFMDAVRASNEDHGN